MRAPSLARLDRALPAVTVRARVTWVTLSLDSDIRSLDDCGFRACATASGPAQCGTTGTATLPRTKLARTVTGSTFSVILSCRAASGRPKTICWTLLYTRRQVWNASAWGLDERSWRYVWS